MNKKLNEILVVNATPSPQIGEKRTDELLLADLELAFQNEEKEKRAAELIIANKELAFQNQEKEKRAAELIIANKELAFQNQEKEKRAAELVIANTELTFQNEEKRKRAAELIIANIELVFQNEEKGKQTAELIAANKELVAFTYVSSHDLQEPLRKIQTFVTHILHTELEQLSESGKFNLTRIEAAATRMRQLITDLLLFSNINSTERKFEPTHLMDILEEVKEELKDTIEENKVTIEIKDLGYASIIAFQFHQLFYNLISNAIKFAQPHLSSHIVVTSKMIRGDRSLNEYLSEKKEYCHITIRDNGIGFEPQFHERIFEVFQKLHSKETYPGTGIGLAIVKKIVDNHNGIVTATSSLGKGATFDIYIPEHSKHLEE
ncbi:MAG: two-component sensor histidine kinase [Chitinophagaceae bacterium]|nr:two-component sensor histidine kinase [Chitinophagaceae bacterium]